MLCAIRHVSDSNFLWQILDASYFLDECGTFASRVRLLRFFLRYRILLSRGLFRIEPAWSVHNPCSSTESALYY